jgi:hypothetical protein
MAHCSPLFSHLVPCLPQDGARLWEALPHFASPENGGLGPQQVCSAFDSIYVSFYKVIIYMCIYASFFLMVAYASMVDSFHLLDAVGFGWNVRCYAAWR